MKKAIIAALLTACSVTTLEAQPGRRSQLASVSQTIGPTQIDIVYRRPVARGRDLYGTLVKWGEIWTPSADSAALLTTSTDMEVNGARLAKGRYALWMIPDSTTWTVIFTNRPAFHLRLPSRSDEVLRVQARPTQGDHMEALAFYFPVAEADSATLHMHWGRTIVPLSIKPR
jgi:hypothetical protein